MTAPDLFSYAEQPRNFRRDDPWTSKEAGRQAQKFITGDQAEILRALRRRPMACEEISDFLGWNDHVRANRRTSELERAGRIERTTETHTNRSGRQACRYRLAQVRA